MLARESIFGRLSAELTFYVSTENFKTRVHLRASSRRSHRPTGQIQWPGRTRNWINLGGKVRSLEDGYTNRVFKLTNAAARSKCRLPNEQGLGRPPKASVLCGCNGVTEVLQVDSR